MEREFDGSGWDLRCHLPSDGSLFGGDSIANEIGRVNDRTEAYGLDGDYYFNVTADGSWTIKIAPQG